MTREEKQSAKYKQDKLDGKLVLTQIILRGVHGRTVTFQDGTKLFVTGDKLQDIHISPQSLYLYYGEKDSEERKIIVSIAAGDY